MATLFKKPGSGHWWVTYIGADGHRHRVTTKTTDRGIASQALADIERREAQKRLGTYDEAADEAAKSIAVGIEDHIKAFAKQLGHESGSPRQATDQKKKLMKLSVECGWKTVRSITASSLVDWLEANSYLSDRTRQSYVQIAKQFTKWAVRHRKALRDPLATVKANPIRKRAFSRRAMREDEWSYLRGYLESKSANDRAILYEFAIVTGLRANEIKSLTMSDLRLDAKQPFVAVRATDTKNAKRAEQFIPPSLAQRLRDYTAKKLPGAAVFRIRDHYRLAAVLRADVAEARAQWLSESTSIAERRNREATDFLAATNHAGEVLDFHCLRHTCGAWLSLRGVHPKAIQRIMRHSSITLTLDTYGHLFPEQQAEAIQALAAATIGEKRPTRKSKA